LTVRWIVADAVDWLSKARGVGAVVTSLPDAEEIGRPVDEWAAWFQQAAAACMKAADETAPAIFYQTDRKADGRVYSKAGLLLAAANESGIRLLWHKIVLRRAVGAIDIHRPTFTHLMAFSVRARPGTASADVIERGKMIYPNAMGLAVAGFACRFAAGCSQSMVDPFCGRGTVPAVASAIGMDATGIDIDPAQIEKAKTLTIKKKGAEAPP
jgi:hypothetical protein